ncbi:MAG: hypothetical protein ACYDHU_12960 [Acidimicrobiales bacterium]
MRGRPPPTPAQLATARREVHKADTIVRHAEAHRDAAVARAEQGVAGALGGLTQARYSHLVTGHGSIRSRADALAAARAVRIRPKVEAAQAHVREVSLAEGHKVLAAKLARRRARNQLARLMRRTGGPG